MPQIRRLSTPILVLVLACGILSCFFLGAWAMASDDPGLAQEPLSGRFTRSDPTQQIEAQQETWQWSRIGDVTRFEIGPQEGYVIGTIMHTDMAAMLVKVGSNPSMEITICRFDEDGPVMMISVPDRRSGSQRS